MRILYVGDLWQGSTALHRYKALKEIHPDIDFIDSSIKKLLNKKINNGLIKLFRFKYDFGVVKDLHKKINANTDMIWLDKANYIDANTLKRIKNKYPNVKIVFYSPDDYLNSFHLTRNLTSSIPFFDYLITTKSYNVQELYNLKARRVLFVNNAFEPSIHRPIELTKDEVEQLSSDILFIGGYEKERCESLIYLANKGFKVKVVGADWKRIDVSNDNLKIVEKWAFENDYVKMICASKICLNFLRKCNRDLQTTRSIEIPACGRLMISEWSSEHELLFEPDNEAVFFKSNQELVEKVDFYLNNEEARTRIARNGYAKCKIAGYSNKETLERVTKIIQNEL